jgi:hypothetical protein
VLFVIKLQGFHFYYQSLGGDNDSDSDNDNDDDESDNLIGYAF